MQKVKSDASSVAYTVRKSSPKPSNQSVYAKRARGLKCGDVLTAAHRKDRSEPSATVRPDKIATETDRLATAREFHRADDAPSCGTAAWPKKKTGVASLLVRKASPVAVQAGSDSDG